MRVIHAEYHIDQRIYINNNHQIPQLRGDIGTFRHDVIYPKLRTFRRSVDNGWSYTPGEVPLLKFNGVWSSLRLTERDYTEILGWNGDEDALIGLITTWAKKLEDTVKSILDEIEYNPSKLVNGTAFFEMLYHFRGAGVTGVPFAEAFDYDADLDPVMHYYQIFGHRTDVRKDDNSTWLELRPVNTHIPLLGTLKQDKTVLTKDPYISKRIVAWCIRWTIDNEDWSQKVQFYQSELATILRKVKTLFPGTVPCAHESQTYGRIHVHVHQDVQGYMRALCAEIRSGLMGKENADSVGALVRMRRTEYSMTETVFHPRQILFAWLASGPTFKVMGNLENSLEQMMALEIEIPPLIRAQVEGALAYAKFPVCYEYWKMTVDPGSIVEPSLVLIHTGWPVVSAPEAVALNPQSSLIAYTGFEPDTRMQQYPLVDAYLPVVKQKNYTYVDVAMICGGVEVDIGQTNTFDSYFSTYRDHTLYNQRLISKSVSFSRIQLKANTQFIAWLDGLELADLSTATGPFHGARYQTASAFRWPPEGQRMLAFIESYNKGSKNASTLKGFGAFCILMDELCNNYVLSNVQISSFGISAPDYLDTSGATKYTYVPNLSLGFLGTVDEPLLEHLPALGIPDELLRNLGGLQSQAGPVFDISLQPYHKSVPLLVSDVDTVSLTDPADRTELLDRVVSYGTMMGIIKVNYPFIVNGIPPVSDIPGAPKLRWFIPMYTSCMTMEVFCLFTRLPDVPGWNLANELYLGPNLTIAQKFNTGVQPEYTSLSLSQVATYHHLPFYVSSGQGQLADALTLASVVYRYITSSTPHIEAYAGVTDPKKLTISRLNGISTASERGNLIYNPLTELGVRSPAVRVNANEICQPLAGLTMNMKVVIADQIISDNIGRDPYCVISIGDRDFSQLTPFASDPNFAGYIAVDPSMDPGDYFAPPARVQIVKMKVTPYTMNAVRAAINPPARVGAVIMTNLFLDEAEWVDLEPHIDAFIRHFNADAFYINIARKNPTIPLAHPSRMTEACGMLVADDTITLHNNIVAERYVPARLLDFGATYGYQFTPMRDFKPYRVYERFNVILHPTCRALHEYYTSIITLVKYTRQ